MLLTNKVALANVLHHICLDCIDKNTDCIINKISKCPFKEGTCSKMTPRMWEMVIEEALGEKDYHKSLINSMCSQNPDENE